MSQSSIPPQHQDAQPGHEAEMTPRPRQPSASYRAAGHLRGKVALITGGDSGIGRAVAIAFAKEGAEIAVVYLNEHDDARETVQLVEAEGSKVVAWAGDIGEESFCRHVVERTIEEFGRLDILVNNAGEQHPQKRLEHLI